jgi:hypothetical protein
MDWPSFGIGAALGTLISGILVACLTVYCLKSSPEEQPLLKLRKPNENWDFGRIHF